MSLERDKFTLITVHATGGGGESRRAEIFFFELFRRLYPPRRVASGFGAQFSGRRRVLRCRYDHKGGNKEKLTWRVVDTVEQVCLGQTEKPRAVKIQVNRIESL